MALLSAAEQAIARTQKAVQRARLAYAHSIARLSFVPATTRMPVDWRSPRPPDPQGVR